MMPNPAYNTHATYSHTTTTRETTAGSANNMRGHYNAYTKQRAKLINNSVGPELNQLRESQQTRTPTSPHRTRRGCHQ